MKSVLGERAGIGALVPERYAAFRPLIADALAFFIGRLAARRGDALRAIRAELPSDADLPTRLVCLMHASPVLHKLGQVIARHRSLDVSLRQRLVQLETFEPKTPPERIRPILDAELAAADPCCAVALEPQPIAEASVAVVWPAAWTDDGGVRRRGVCKVLRPGVTERLHEELAVLAELADDLDARRDEYDAGQFEHRETFDTVHDILAGEVRLDGEQEHLAAARGFYAGCGRVIVPALLPFCTPRLTAMERIDGGKVSDCAGLSDADRDRLARTIVEAMIARVVFSRLPAVPFHADPHAGNLFAAPDGRLAILDWSLTGSLTKQDRERVAQIIVAALTLDAGRLARSVAAVTTRPPSETDLRRLAEDAVQNVRCGRLPGLHWLVALLDAVAAAGGRFPADQTLFRKTLLTLDGVVADVSPDRSADAVLIAAAAAELGAEWPRRLLAPPFSRDFATHLSNADFAGLAAGLPAWWGRQWTGFWQSWLRGAGHAWRSPSTRP